MTKSLRTLLIFCLVQTPLLAFAQDDGPSVHQMSTTPANARFEIVHSPLAAKWTFRLDRYTGNIAQLVNSVSGGSAWESMTVLGLPKVDSSYGPRFILLASGLAARFMFLMDTQSGKTWEITSISKGGAEPETVWQPFDD
jgi:hypothetical protein